MSSEKEDPHPVETAAPAMGIDTRGPLAAVAMLSCFLLLTLASGRVGESALPYTLDPTGRLTVFKWVLLYGLTIPAKAVLNFSLEFLCGSVFGMERMDNEDEKVKKLAQLQTIDLCYLALNTMVEFIGMIHVYATITDMSMSNDVRDFSLLTGPAAFLLIILANDAIFYPFHYVAHGHACYPYWHKQHHRNMVSFRGHGDAANQHPIEQGCAFCIFIVCVIVVNRHVGVHGASAWTAAIVWVVLNIGNYLPYNSNIHLPLPFPAYPRHHQMHQRMQHKCNYGTLTLICDRLFGTFQEWQALDYVEPPPPRKLEWYEKSRDPAAALEKQNTIFHTIGRPAAFPSPWSVLGLLAFMFSIAIVLDTNANAGLPPLNEVFGLFTSGVIGLNVAFVICAVESACSSDGGKKKSKSEKVYTMRTMAQVEKDACAPDSSQTQASHSEAVPKGHHRRMVGGKGVFKPNLKDAVRKDEWAKVRMV